MSYNHLILAIGGQSARVDYLPSHVDEEDGAPSVRSLVQAIRAA